MNQIKKVYAAYSMQLELRKKSSSGAVFSLIARNILEQNGVVYGVAMSRDLSSAEFVRAGTEEELSRLRGSKYLQAKAGKVFLRVREDLENGLTVLFTGTGCQIMGLRSFLNKDYESLYCVDVVCHGVPSPKLWREYVDYLEEKHGSRLVDVDFRCKDKGESAVAKLQPDHNKTVLYNVKDSDPYMLMFLRNYSLRPSCYECAAKTRNSADLSVADFWGINEVMRSMNDKDGVSLVIARTKKGCELFDGVKDKVVWKETSYETGVKKNSAVYSSVKRPSQRDSFFIDMEAMSFEELRTKYAVPAETPLKIKIKNAVKKTAQRVPISKIRRLSAGAMNFGMAFTLEKKK